MTTVAIAGLAVQPAAMPEYAVLIPTHDHGQLLDRTLVSVRDQTRADFEVLVVGDGAGEDTAAVVARHATDDERIRWFPFPKGARHGEASRHPVLNEDCRSPAVLYCSDDDLWFPEHAERTLALLEDADFAHALKTWFNPDGAFDATFVDAGTAYGRGVMLRRERRIGLSVMAHTMEGYRRLPRGWNPAPDDIPTDQWMIGQWLAQDWVRVASGGVPTTISLPSPGRRDWTPAQRLEELLRYEALMADPAWRLRHAEDLLAMCVRESTWFAGEAETVLSWGKEQEAWARELERRLGER